MKDLEYPFDVDMLLAKKKKIKRKLLEESTNLTKKNIAILGGYTTDNIKQMMEIFLLNQGILPIFYESEYNQYYQDAMFSNNELERFSPDIIYICTCNRNIKQYPDLDNSSTDIASILDNEYNIWETMWNRLSDVYNCPVIQNNMEMPFYRIMGNKEASDIHGTINFLTRLNLKFYEYAQTHNNFYICDINYISADYGLKKWSDPFYWYMYKYAVAVPAIPYLSQNVANIIKSIFGKNKKGFVLDLDNTLWGGVIGDDGVDGIVIGPEESEGQAYTEFQRYIKKHKDLGIILNIDSKNDMDNALEGLNHPDNELNKDDFIEIQANWESKDINYKKISSALNLLPESLVFIDDNPAERHIVTEQIQGVSSPELGEVYQYIQNIDHNGFFEVTSLSADDKNRNDMYMENAKRRRFEATFTNYDDYLKSLDMRAEIAGFKPLYLSRIAQLTNKSNQFNLTTKRYTQAEIEDIAENGTYITLYGKLEDKFGDNGVVSVIIGHIKNDICHIDLWIMSCRVLKRNMEYAMMDALCKACLDLDIHIIRGYYYPTSKNNMVKEHYKSLGFSFICEDAEGNTEWEYKIPSVYTNKQNVIKILL